MDMTRMIFTLVALAGMAATTSAQTTLYRLSGSTAQIWDGAIWLYTDSTDYHYSYGEVDTLVGLFTYNSLDATWDKYSQNMTNYDAQGNETQNLRLLWDGAAFVNDLKWDFTYDAQNQLISNVRYNWDGTDWVPYLRITYTYNAQGQTLARVTELYTAGSWTNSERSLYAYTNNMLEVYENQTWTSGMWQKQLRNVYTYDSLGNKTMNLGQNWIAPAYQNNYMYLYTYDANNNMLTDAYIDWVSGAWDSISRDLYSYNANDQVDTVFKQLWDPTTTPSNPRWQTHQRNITIYNSLGQPDSLKYQEYLGLAYIGDKVITKLEYDAHGNNTLATTTELVHNGTAWVFENQSRQLYYYESYMISGIASAQAEVATMAYPNPFTEKLCFALPDGVDGPVTISLYNMDGKRLVYLSQSQTLPDEPLTIDASNLPCGQYIYHLNINGKTAKGLVVK